MNALATILAGTPHAAKDVANLTPNNAMIHTRRSHAAMFLVACPSSQVMLSSIAVT
jgi:hypothetical protein